MANTIIKIKHLIWGKAVSLQLLRVTTQTLTAEVTVAGRQAGMVLEPQSRARSPLVQKLKAERRKGCTHGLL